ncbi:MAG: peptidylprolyl isomerase [Hyphomicrobium sp.]
MIGRVLREPLVHFLGLAITIFLLYGTLNRSKEPEAGEILVTSSKLEQLAGLFGKTWQRPPTAQELKGLVDDYVKEELYYREALLLGLEKDDTVIRRRLRQKMEFLADAEAGSLMPSDTELDSYLKANAGQFRIESLTSFQQIFLNPTKRGESAGKDAQALLEALRVNAQADLATLGDQTLLPAVLPLTAKTAINQTFGDKFAEELESLPADQWSGPVESSYGLHLVRVTGRQNGREPALAEVRDAVLRDWSNTKRKALEQDRIGSLMKRYKVTIEGLEKAEARR